jgi:prepilin peptidase CpaA
MAVVLVAAFAAAVLDVWKFKVSNAVTVPLLVSGLLYHGLAGGPSEFAGSMLGMVFGFGILIGFYILGGMGAGDVKLLAAVGAWLGMPHTFYVFIASSLATGVYALVLVLASGRLGETWVSLQLLWHRLAVIGRHLGADDRVEAEVNRADRRRRLIPFAAMVALGILATFVWSTHRELTR